MNENLNNLSDNWDTLLTMLIVFALPALGVGYLLSKHTQIGLLEPVVMLLVLCAVFGMFNIPAINLVAVIAFGAALAFISWSLIFVFYCVIALFSKRCVGKLVRFEVPKGMKSAVACYDIDGEVHHCLVGGIKKEFAENGEGKLSKKYIIGKEYNVRYSRLLKKVYDKRAVMISAACVMVSIIGALFFILPMIFMEKLPP
ncbi:MAG: hypothetical protein K6G33_02260 [Ruminococcus sp.]|uniref:hypothetical protein n=1 Tax=Ruminococcus sp. TaxID=41978 RepID=UPI0025DA263A|nr:hypothetical protein [Ruminococcus sp.]MCR5599553.1 hypothetical protein [Ruminococcus sp.]